MKIGKLGTQTGFYIVLFDTDGKTRKTGQGNTSFNKCLTKDGSTVSSVSVAVTEVDPTNRPGEYFVTFTPAATGQYLLDVTNFYGPNGFTEEFQVTADGLITLSDIQAYLDANSTKLANLDTNIGSRVSTADSRLNNLDVTVSSRMAAGNVTLADGSLTEVKFGTGAISARVLAADALASIASAVWNFVVGVAYSAKRYLKVAASAVAGKTSGGPTGFTARDLEDSQDQVVGTADTSGNRTPTSYGP